ncbi:DNA/RNA polymerase, partial [Rhodotorula sp. JG-1b]
IRFRLSALDFVPSVDRSQFDNRRSPFCKGEMYTVPVIRIFGATDRGQRVCAHVHGAFPYVYVEYKGKLDPTSVSDYIRRFGAALNRAMGLALPSKHKKGQPTQYVAFIVLCKGVPFYGYHVGYVPYLKIYIVHPRHKTRLSEVLRSGAVLGTPFDVFEAHVPFLLQFMLDANLFGCGWVEVGKCLFREDVPGALSAAPLDPEHLTETSYMRLELDLPVSAIINRRRLTARNLHHDFIEMLHPEQVERGKNVRSVRELWEDEQRRRAARGESGPYDLVDKEPRKWDERPKDAPIWKREPEFRAKVKAQLDDDLRKYRERKERVIERTQSFWMDRIRTAFEQVDAIYVERFIEDESKNYPFGAWAVRGFGLNSTRLKRRPQDQVGGSDDDEGMEADTDLDDDLEDGEHGAPAEPLQPTKRVQFAAESPIPRIDTSGTSVESLQPPVLDKSSNTTAECKVKIRALPAWNISLTCPSNTADETTAVSRHVSASMLAPRFDVPLAQRTYLFAEAPPTSLQAESTMEAYGRAKVVYKDPHYSDPADVPRRDREYGGKRFRLRGSTMRFLPAFKHYSAGSAPRSDDSAPKAPRAGRVQTWEFSTAPPSSELALQWLEQHGAFACHAQIEGPTQKNGSGKFQAIKGAAISPTSSEDSPSRAETSLCFRTVNTRGTLLPDPQHDAIQAIFYCLQSDNEDLDVNGRAENTHVGVIAVGNKHTLRVVGITDYDIHVVEDERTLIDTFVEWVRYDWDPECLGGYEVHHASWGYLLERAEAEYGWNLVPELGRVRVLDTGRFGDAQSDRWGYNQSSVLNFTGRHVLPIWRILKADNKFQQYSFEHIAFHVLGVRTPRWSHCVLSDWYTSDDPAKVARVFNYYRNRVEMDIEMLDAAEIVDQSCESARVFGVDFHSVRTRGSQFKVESVMFKISKPESFMLLSPNRVQVGRQNAAECQPLIMEPQSAFYKGPLLVMDFQSLYPSVMIAYNYCYSQATCRTCLGRVNTFKGSNKFGVSEINLPEGNLHLLREHITVSPNGMMFVKPEIRKSLLAKMLSELLDTRVMVKSSMKAVQQDRALTKLLNARQLALKFLANVTYGYTSATFSGRMPAVEIADAIVQTGRETLERAKETIEAVKDWGAKVVYGDTDSLFIYLPGKSKDEAFRIGDEIAERVTSLNPRPIKLKFEKVYLPSVLLAKKRYVGFKYEYKAQKDPDFDAKGIETVRRDGIAATQKMQETCLKILFRTSDLSLVKSFCQRQWKKLIVGEVSPQDFVIAKAVKLGSYAEGRLPPPGAAVATRAMLDDPRAEPEYGERVPYLMFQAEPGQPQVHRAISPEEFLADPRLRLDSTHYIERMMIPPLERIFNLVGADVKAWYREMGKSKRIHKVTLQKSGAKPIMLEEHFTSDRCIALNPFQRWERSIADLSLTLIGLCAACLTHPSETIYSLTARKHALLSRRHALHKICVSCSANPAFEAIVCNSTDCPNHYARVR